MQITVRINGVDPKISELGEEGNSERIFEVKKQNIISNTSCSIFSKNEHDQNASHVLVDVGNGVISSIERGFPSLRDGTSYLSDSHLPNALLITHSHDDHIAELPSLIEKITNSSKNLQIFCTEQCYEQIVQKFPHLSSIISSNSTSVINNNTISVNVIYPNNNFKVDNLSITPILADHGSNTPAGSVIYVVDIDNIKIVFGWDFLSLVDVDENILWNPDLLILGTNSYNPHPETGMISVSDAYSLIRQWNAKESYIVHYSGLADLVDAKNQWFRGPTKPMTSEELQKVVDSSGPISGAENLYSFKITVAKEGMLWHSKTQFEEPLEKYNGSDKIGNELLIEGLEKYVLKFEHNSIEDNLRIMVEDRINRRDLSFVRPHKDSNNDNIVYAEAVKGGMRTRGPELRMEVLNTIPQSAQSREDSAVVRMHAYKGKKDVYKNDIRINNLDAVRLKRYLQENLT